MKMDAYNVGRLLLEYYSTQNVLSTQKRGVAIISLCLRLIVVIKNKHHTMSYISFSSLLNRPTTKIKVFMQFL